MPAGMTSTTGVGASRSGAAAVTGFVTSSSDVLMSRLSTAWTVDSMLYSWRCDISVRGELSVAHMQHVSEVGERDSCDPGRRIMSVSASHCHVARDPFSVVRMSRSSPTHPHLTSSLCLTCLVCVYVPSALSWRGFQRSVARGRPTVAICTTAARRERHVAAGESRTRADGWPGFRHLPVECCFIFRRVCRDSQRRGGVDFNLPERSGADLGCATAV